MNDKSNINSEKSLNIVFTGGGTGGHIYPCLAIIEELITEKPSANIFYIGNSNKLEYELLTQNVLKDYRGISFSDYVKFLTIQAEPLIKSLNPIKVFKWFSNFFAQVSLCKKYLRENKISVVFGTGGYVSGPVFAACNDLKIPYIIHNLDAFIGIANAMFVGGAYALTMGLESKQKIKPRNGRLIITGNPISRKFLSFINEQNDVILREPQSGDREDLIAEGSLRPFGAQDDKLSLLITGGSQGAESINNAIGDLLPELSKLNIQITHVTGSKTYEGFVKKYLDGNVDKYPNFQVIAYTHEMPKLCSEADITVCRAGAMTIAEMCVSGVVPIFVPLPWAAHDHQNLNAKTLVEGGAAYSLNQDDKDFKVQLLDTTIELISNQEKLNAMREKLKAFANADAAKKILEIIEEAE